ncbi:hypothetical protein E4U21_004984 [Claviceps maximensis]|nr:hypothetical protein E4U21_004984 [Claviceps maximensis]
MHLSSLLPLLVLAAASPAKKAEPAALLAPGENAKVIAGKYIVKLKDHVDASGLSGVVKSLLAGEPEQTYDGVFKGFATTLDEAGLKSLQEHPDIDYIEPDQEVSGSAIVRQPNPPWGLSRISHRNPGLFDYVFDDAAGAGVCVYVIDSGVDATHPDFRGRAFQIQSYVPGSNIDDNGHGTHVAGTVGSYTFGVAKKVIILGVKVLRADNRGEWSAIIKGMDFVYQDAPKRRAQCPGGFVVNMSLGGGRTQAVNDAARKLTSAGFFVAVAAGNDNQDARNVSPASEAAVCTVGGTAKDDTRYSMSNWGPALDILGPGVDVVSTYPGNRVASLTGTSMATPHIAGLGAYLASIHRKTAGPWLCAEMQRIATKNAIKNQVANTVNLLAFNGAT